MYIDTHCHLDDYEKVDEIVNNMQGGIMIASGADLETSKFALLMAEKYANVFASVGIHPSEVKNMNKNDIDNIEQMLNNDKVVAVGEIGLDYYWDQDNKEEQKDIFIKQIKLAQKYNLPIVIHSREAINDTYEILKEQLNDTKAVLHCYSGSYEMSLKFIEIGVKFGIGGVATFKNSRVLREVIEKNDVSNFVIETDSPYLTPEPFRGEKNEPCNVKYVVKKIAEIKNIDEAEVLKITNKNTNTIFDLNTKI